jgi:hypothetical protein
MHGCKIVKKDGSEVLGTLWALNRGTWCFDVTTDDGLISVPIGECESAVQYGGRSTAATVGEDEDLMERARKWGWTG